MSVDRSSLATMVVGLGALVAALGTGLAVAAPVDVRPTGGDANGDYLAVSNGGNAYAGGLGVAISSTGCATAPYGLVAVSATGCASAATLSISGTGPAGYSNPACGGAPGCGGASASGTNCAASWHVSLSATGCASGDVALSGTGDATGRNSLDTGLPFTPDLVGIAASGTGNASGGTVAVAPDGNATAYSGTVWYLGVGVPVPAVAVASGNATASGGLATVSLTGSGGGGSVTNVCPMGRCG